METKDTSSERQRVLCGREGEISTSPGMEKGSYQPSQSAGRGEVGHGQDKVWSVGKEEELGKCRLT